MEAPLYPASHPFQRTLLLYTDQLNFSPFDPSLTASLTVCLCVCIACVCVSLRVNLYTSTRSTLVLCLMEPCSSSYQLCRSTQVCFHSPLFWFHTPRKALQRLVFVYKCVCLMSLCFRCDYI